MDFNWEPRLSFEGLIQARQKSRFALCVVGPFLQVFTRRHEDECRDPIILNNWSDQVFQLVHLFALTKRRHPALRSVPPGDDDAVRLRSSRKAARKSLDEPKHNCSVFRRML